MSSFIHLHNHSDFSLLESSQSIQSIVDRAKELSMDAIALTEKGNLFSMIDFYKYAKKNQVKPIIGCEINVEHDLHKKFVLVLLAKNNTGYLNLMKLVSLSHLNSNSNIPSVDFDLIEKYKEGIIALSSGLNGEVAYYASNNDYDTALNSAKKLSRFLMEIFI